MLYAQQHSAVVGDSSFASTRGADRQSSPLLLFPMQYERSSATWCQKYSAMSR